MSSDQSEQPRELTEHEASAARFYEGAERRLLLGVPLLAVPLAIAIYIFSTRAVAYGFVLGAAIAFINLRWLHRSSKKVISALAVTKLSSGTTRLKGLSISFGAVLRLALVTGTGYAIFRHSIESLYGFAGGLGISMLAMFAEAIFEAWVAVRRGL